MDNERNDMHDAQGNELALGPAPAPPALEKPKRGRPARPNATKDPGTKKSVEFNTPAEVIGVVVRTIAQPDERPIGFDPASNHFSIVPSKYAVYTPANAERSGETPIQLAARGILVGDGLVVSWTDPKSDGPGRRTSFFVNSPYSAAANKKWAPKIRAEGVIARTNGAEGFALVQCSPGTANFAAYWSADVLCFIDHRVCFIDGETGFALPGANFDSVLCYWGSRAESFWLEAESIGRCVWGHR